jgi:hypothetical protein
MTDELIRRMIDKVKKPDRSFDLNDVALELAVEIGVPLTDAKRIVWKFDRKHRLRVGHLRPLT